MERSHRICDEFIAHRRQCHPMMSGAINFYLFYFLRFENKKWNFFLVTKIIKDLKVDGFKCVTHLLKLETKQNGKSQD